MKGNYVIQLRLVAIMETQLTITTNVTFCYKISIYDQNWELLQEMLAIGIHTFCIVNTHNQPHTQYISWKC